MAVRVECTVADQHKYMYITDGNGTELLLCLVKSADSNAIHGPPSCSYYFLCIVHFNPMPSFNTIIHFAFHT